MSEFTPTTEQVRQAYAGVHSDAFDRWLAQHDAEVRKQVAEEIAAAIEAKYLGPDFGRSFDGRESPNARLQHAFDEGLEVAASAAREIGGAS